MNNKDQMIINKLANVQSDELNEETVLYTSDNGDAVKAKDIRSIDLSSSDISELPDAIGMLTSLIEINISGTKITSLPDSIRNLSCLQSLNISGTPLTNLPDSIGNLKSLKELYVRKTRIKSLPDSIGNLINLQRLDVIETGLTRLPNSIGNLKMLQVFKVNNTDLTLLPDSIGNLINLQILSASNTKLTALPDSIGNLSDLRRLDISRTPITSLPDSIGNLTNLYSLNLVGTHLTFLPDSIGNLSGLRGLGISGTRLTTLPDSIGKLTGISSLYVSGMSITSLPDSIGNLTNLQSLNVSWTSLANLPDSLGNLSGLQKLDASRTPLTSLPDSIGDLTSLENADFSETQLTNLPQSIGKLHNLRILDVSGAPLTSLPDSIGNLTNLESLHAGETLLTRLPTSVKSLKKLSLLDISRTKINELNSELCELPSIETLILEELSLDRIPKELLKTGLDFITKNRSEFKKGIYIHNLSLTKQPISLFYQNRDLIDQYFSEEKVSINSAKIIFLGDGEVGKTYTLKRLLNGGKKATDESTYPTKTTHGILIKPFSVVEGDVQYDIKLWDFGGQQIMHSMHRCFLTERSCYVIILSTRTDRDLMGQARYWLRTVNSFAPNSPVIVLVNQWTKNQIKVDETRLRHEFRNISEFLYFSVVEAEDDVFLTLKSSVMEHVRQLDSYGMEFPGSWYELMTDLEKESRNYISKNTYHRMCFERGLRYEDNNEEGIYEWLLDWFNDLGICFSYHKNTNSQRLDNYELLNPQWLTRAAYVIINSGGSIAENGILTKAQIEEVLKNTDSLDFDDMGMVSYEAFEIDYILEILRKFRISYRLPDGRELIPVLCCENSSGNIKPEWFIPGEMKHTSYELQYEYLPDTIIHRLMIFCYQSHYNVRDRWRKGMRVDFNNDEYAGITAVIDSGSENQSITIDIYSDGIIPCWVMLKKLRDEILSINTELKLKADDYIVMETDGIKDKFSVDAVLKRRARGKTDYPAEKYDGDYEISDILGSAYGTANTAVIEKILESTSEVLTVEKINQIIDYFNQLSKALDGITERSKNIELQAYQTKDLVTESILQNKEVSKELLRILTEKDNLKSKLAVSSDIITLVQALFPGFPAVLTTEFVEWLALCCK